VDALFIALPLCALERLSKFL
jgi:hypothetical protein